MNVVVRGAAVIIGMALLSMVMVVPMRFSPNLCSRGWVTVRAAIGVGTCMIGMGLIRSLAHG